MAEQRNIRDEQHLPDHDGKLLEYLHGSMNAEDRLRFEKDMESGEFENEALQGLQMIDKKNIEGLVTDLNGRLKKQIRKNKRKPSALPSGFGWTYYAVVLILLLILLCYWIFSRLQQ